MSARIIRCAPFTSRSTSHLSGHTLVARRLHPHRRTWEYHAARGVCATCALRQQCTRATYGRTIKRHEHQELLDQARAQAHSRAACRDRCRRMHLIEGSFADAANNHHFKRSRWRRLWRQQIQDYLIAAIQNVRILLKDRPRSCRVPGFSHQHASRRLLIAITHLFGWKNVRISRFNSDGGEGTFP